MIQTLRTKEAVTPNRLGWNGVNAFTISDKFEDNYAIGFEYTFLAYFVCRIQISFNVRDYLID